MHCSKDELKMHEWTQQLSVRLITWNVYQSKPVKDLQGVLGLEETLPDIYAIGLQEIPMMESMIIGCYSRDPWTNTFKEVLGPNNYVLLKTARLGWMLLLLFVKRHHLLRLTNFQSTYVRTGFGGYWGNKGAVILSFEAYGTSLCIVNSHLAAHDTEEGRTRRIQEFHQIDNYLRVNNSDYTFWMGDLNFRLRNHSLVEVNDALKSGQSKSLLEKEDLIQMIRNKEAFTEFCEMDINFKPTYRYFVNIDEYSMGRKPSWTDRILYKQKQKAPQCRIEGKQYKAHQQYLQSDHKPVSAVFTIQVGDIFPECQVIFPPPLNPWVIGETNTFEYNIIQERLPTIPNSWDWIGLFEDDFWDLSDYITWVYAPVASDDKTGIHYGSFSKLRVQPGQYRLLYFNSKCNAILGMSNSFQIISQPQI